VRVRIANDQVQQLRLGLLPAQLRDFELNVNNAQSSS
jgi:hypothetical protein